MEQKNEKLNIICFANQQWDYPLPTNKKHVMSRLAAAGHNVLYVDPPINTGRLLVRQLLNGKWPLKRLLTCQYTDGDVLVVSPLNFLPFYDVLSRLHAKIINSSAKKHFDPSRKTVTWIYHVEIQGLKNYLKDLDYDLLVYDCVDNYAGFPKYDTPEKREEINNQEKMLSRAADIVFASAPGLVDKLRKYNGNVHFTPNVGDYEKFKKVPSLKNEIPEDIKNISRPIIGFTGAVDEYKLDKKLVKKLAEDYPSYSFVIIGPLALTDRDASMDELGFRGLRNIYIMGTREYNTIPNYYAAFDVFIIPYQLNEYTVGGCFPVKFHDALAAGLPVVVTDLPAYKPFANVSYISKSYNEFSQNIRKALEENNEAKVNERVEVAKDNSWEGKVQKMLGFIYEELDKQ